MSRQQADGRWAAREAGPRGVVALDVVAAVLLFALSAWAVWPVYGTARGPLVLGAGLLLGALVAFVGARRSWSWGRTTLAVLVVYLVSVIPLAVPSALEVLPANLAYGALEIVRAPVTAWKDLATTPLPVGDFGALLVPALVVGLLASVVAFSVLLRVPGRAAWATAALLAPMVFAVAWGAVGTSAPVRLLGWRLAQPREMALGAAWVVVVVVWLTARARWGEHRLEHREVRTRRGWSWGSDAQRSLLAAGMVVVALAVALVAAPDWASTRTVVRSVVHPDSVAQPQTTPLSSFRSYFEASRLDTDVFHVTGAPSGSRLRVATLAYYDGDVFEVLDPDDPQGRLPRLAYRIPAPDVDHGRTVTAAVTVTGYRGSWVPTLGRALGVSFQGRDSRALDSSLFADPATASVLEVAGRGQGGQGLEPGDSYRVTFREPSEPADSEHAAGSPRVLTQEEAPELFAWIAEQDVSGATIGDVRALVDAMMQRSYLGHSLLEPVPDSTGATWLSQAQQQDPSFGFRSSYAGHGLARIDDGVFGAMNAAPATCSQEQGCAATVGDQEQYAVAAALIAEAKGFPARVVMGAVVPADGVVRGKDMTAWTEVQASDGRWATIDVAPRTDNAFVDDETARAPEQVPTTVTDHEATELAPPAQKPQTGNTPDAHEQPVTPPAPSRWWPVLRDVLWGLLVLLVLALPVVVVVGGKALRRRRRRRAADPVARIAGGWQEYVDAHVDAGGAPPGTATRTEVARRYGGERGSVLADQADRAVFGDVEPGPGDAEAYWSLVAHELAGTRSAQGWVRRWRSAMSLRSVRSTR